MEHPCNDADAHWQMDLVMNRSEIECQYQTTESPDHDHPVFNIGSENPDENGNISDENSNNSTPAAGTIPCSIGEDDMDMDKSPMEKNNIEISSVVNESAYLISLHHSEGEASVSSKLKVKIPSRTTLAPDLTHVPLQPSDIIEYEWPHKSGDCFFVQEQISELLGIISFKRKYPDMIRRTIQPKERDYLIKELKIQIALPSHHLTALQSGDVHELMCTEYPEIYAAYQKACNERIKTEMIEKQKELEAIRLDEKKLAELRQKAIKSAREFNSDLQAIRKAERTQYWDLNTNIIHSPINKWMRLSKEYTRPSNYPVFLIPGQYTSYYKKFDSVELRSLPLNSVLAENGRLFPPKRDSSPQSIIVTEEEIAAAEKANVIDDLDGQREISTNNNINNTKRIPIKQESRSPQREKEMKSIGSPPLKLRKMSNTIPKKNSSFTGKIQLSPKTLAPLSKLPPLTSTSICSICQMSDIDSSNEHTAKSLMVCCSACSQQMHSSCIDMPPSMVEVIRQYEWLCIDCKRCCVCEQPDQEAAMMCCDQCDRGYHTFCIGLDQPPNGTWHCPHCPASKSNGKT